MSRLFLSYSRADEPLARALHVALTGDAFDVWFDRKSMPSRSLTFLQEIRIAIDGVDRVLVIFSQAALESEYVRAEWQHALTADKVVVPILREGDPKDLPPEFRNLHAVDFRATRAYNEAYAELHRVLRDPIPPLGTLHGSLPGSPPHFQPRPDVFTQLADMVLVDLENPVSISGPASHVVLHGMAGTGKSVIAAALARSTAARRSFPHGVFWLAIGTDADGLAIARRLAALLPGAPAAPASLELAHSTLRQRLAGKRALVVLDDVWEVEQLNALDGVSDVNTRVLVTTTVPELVIASGARGIACGDLSEEAALRLLADWVGTAVELLPEEARDLARECGCHPLALALNGAMLRARAPWSDLIKALKEADLNYANLPIKSYPRGHVGRSLQVSMDALARHDSTTADRFKELAALNWAQGVPETAVARLWRHRAGLTERHAARLMSQLEQRALVRVEGTAPHRTLRLHSLQLAYLRGVSKDLVPPLTQAVVAAYRDACGGDWPSGPADGYFHQNLVHHLNMSGRPDEVHDLLALEKDGRNAWFEAKADLGLVGSYVDDIALARELDARSGDAAPRVALRARYGLIASSIQSQAKAIPPGLLHLCVQNEVLRIERALSYARAPSLDEQRVAGLAALIPLAAPEKRAGLEVEGVETALAIDELGRLRSALRRLIPRLSPMHASRVFEWARRIENDNDRSWWMAPLAEVVPATDLEALLRVGGGLHASLPAVRALVAVAKRAPQDRAVSRAAWTMANRLSDPGQRVRALALVAPVGTAKNRAGLGAKALAAAGTIRGSQDLADALAEIAPRLTETELENALELATRTANSDDHVRALFGIVPFLSEARRSEVVTRQVALHRPKPGAFPWGADYVALLACDLPEPLRAEIVTESLPSIVRLGTLPGDEIFSTPRPMRPWRWQVDAGLEILARRLPTPYVERALDIVAQVDDAEDRAELLRCLAPRLANAHRRRQVLRAELDRVLQIADTSAVRSALAAFSRWVPELERQELANFCIEHAEGTNASRNLGVFVAVVPQLARDRSRTLVAQELTRIASMDSKLQADAALAVLVPILECADIGHAAAMARTTLDDHAYQALARLAGSLEAEDRHLAIDQILAAVSGWVLGELPEDFAEALHYIVAWMSTTQIEAAVSNAESVAQHYGRDRVYAKMVRNLAPRLSPLQVATLYKNVHRLQDKVAQIAALVALANSPGVVADRQTYVDAALTARECLTDPAQAAQGLRALAGLSASEQHRFAHEALEAARGITADDERALVLGGLLGSLPAEDALSAFDQMVRASLGVERAGGLGGGWIYQGIGRAELLARLEQVAPWLGSTQGEDCASRVVRAVREVVRWWP